MAGGTEAGRIAWRRILVKTLAALNRFGLGRAPRRRGEAAADPRGFVRDQIVRPVAALDASLPAGDAALRAMRMVELGREAERTRAASLAPAAQPADGMRVACRVAWRVGWPMAAECRVACQVACRRSGAPSRRRLPCRGPVKPPRPRRRSALFRAEAAARFNRLATTENGLVERLAMFWTNHFAVSTAKGNTLRVAGRAFRARGDPPARARPLRRHAARCRDASGDADLSRQPDVHRPELPRRTQSQSQASTRTSRARSSSCTRWGSTAAIRRRTSPPLRSILTGWTFSAPDEDAIYGGRFTFAPARHEPGPQTVLGRIYSGEGHGAGRGGAGRPRAPSLHGAASSPASSPAISWPTTRRPLLVERLAKVFSDTDGDLDAVTRELIDAPEAWTTPLTKMRTPLGFRRQPACGPPDAFPSQARARGAQRDGPAALAAARPERLARPRGRLGIARGHGRASRCRRAVGHARTAI